MDINYFKNEETDKIQNFTNDIANIKEHKYKNVINTINTEEIIFFISSYLSSIINNNKIMKKKQINENNEPLYSKYVPVLSLKKYIIRIIKYTEAENNTLILAFIYIRKLIQKQNFIIRRNNIYILLLTSVVIAKKVIEDNINYNSYYCGIGGISVKKLNMAEYSLLIRINFEVNIKNEEIIKIYVYITEFLFSYKLNKMSNILFSKKFHSLNISDKIYDNKLKNIKEIKDCKDDI